MPQTAAQQDVEPVAVQLLRVSSHGLCGKARPSVLFVLPPCGGLRSKGIYFYL